MKDITNLLTAFDNPNNCYPQDLVDAIRLLVKQRDEARRMYCNAIPENCDEHEARKIAWERGWDCFKEDGK